MKTKFYVHHRENYSVAGKFDYIEEAYEFINREEFKKLVGLQNTLASDYVVDEIVQEEDERCFVFYHVTSPSKVDSIFEHGLIPLLGPVAIFRNEKEKAIFTFASVESTLEALETWFGPVFLKEDKCDEGHCNMELEFVILSVILPYEIYNKAITANTAEQRNINASVPPELISVALKSEEV